MIELHYQTAALMLDADFRAGKLFWKARPPELFSSKGGPREIADCKRWNTRFAGQEAFTALNGQGYKTAIINGRKFLAHRVLWLLHTGQWPVEHIDHINGVRSDNRISNLRAVSFAENQRNRRIHSSNKSGVIGVDWHKATNKWRAQIGGKPNNIHLGLFPTIEEAIAARKSAEASLGYHPNHGRQA